MGYCSDVSIMCEEKAFSVLKDIFLDKDNFIVPDRVKQVTEFESKKVYLVEWYDCKWFDDFIGVDKIMQALHKFEEELEDAKGYEFYFIRVGEDPVDIDIMDNACEFYLDVITRIEHPFETKEIPLAELKQKLEDKLNGSQY